jgi:hypothetical protein
MDHPTYDAEAEGENVRLRFAVPGSKFGPVQVLLDFEECANLFHLLSLALARVAWAEEERTFPTGKVNNA